MLGKFLRDVMKLNADSKNFRVFGPDETASNRLDAIYEATDKIFMEPMLPTDEHLSVNGRVMEILSEHMCQGWLEGYLLTGRHGFFSCYEAFIHIVDSMFNQHAKWLKVTRNIPWRRPIASLNYLLTSHVWRQDHNGFQPPGSGLHRSRGEQEGGCGARLSASRREHAAFGGRSLPAQPQLRECDCRRQATGAAVAGHGSPPSSIAPLESGFGTGPAPTKEAEPDVVMACAGDIPTLETLAAVDLLRPTFSGYQDPRRQCGRPDDAATQERTSARAFRPEFDSMFTTDKPIIFAYHGYPWLIHRLTYRRTNHDNLHVRGYKEEGTTTTPFDMTVLN